MTHICACTYSSPYSLSHFSRASAPELLQLVTQRSPWGTNYEYFFHFFPLTLIFIRQTNPLRTGNILIPTLCFFYLLFMLKCGRIFRFYACTSYSLFLFVSVPLEFQKTCRYWAIHWSNLSVSTADKRAGTEGFLMVRAHPWGCLLISPVTPHAIWQGPWMPAQLLQCYNA